MLVDREYDGAGQNRKKHRNLDDDKISICHEWLESFFKLLKV